MLVLIFRARVGPRAHETLRYQGKNSDDTGNRSRDLPTCSAVPELHIYTRPITPRFHPFPSLHFTSLHFYVFIICFFHILLPLWQFWIDGMSVYRVSQDEWTKLRESVPYVKIYRYNPKHLCPKLNGYGDNGHRKVCTSGVSRYCTPSVTPYPSSAQARQPDTAS